MEWKGLGLGWVDVVVGAYRRPLPMASSVSVLLGAGCEDRGGHVNELGGGRSGGWRVVAKQHRGHSGRVEMKMNLNGDPSKTHALAAQAVWAHCLQLFPGTLETGSYS